MHSVPVTIKVSLDEMNGNFASYLSSLGYEVKADATVTSFTYTVHIGHLNDEYSPNVCVPYFYFDRPEDLFLKHLEIWNRNQISSFIAVFGKKTYVIDSRQKPDEDIPLSSRHVIKSFDYGVNSPDYNFTSELALITKRGIDNSSYFDFVIRYQTSKKAYEVDKDLLLNLLALRNELVTKQNEQIIHLLLLRCLFVKYLEDRGVFEKLFLLSALSDQSPSKLISAFKKVRKINGDLFTTSELRPEDLHAKYLKKLSDFFGCYDYKTKQGKLFPYQFDKIPIQLISSIYESFLREETKKDKGVYYTPSILVKFILAQTVNEKLKASKAVTVLDPACGSGAFLVEAFRSIIAANDATKDYEKKKSILQSQLFGIDLDPRALQIAAFSLYLALLEGEDPSFIQEKIRIEAPILPSLIGKTLVNANALADDVNFNSKANEEAIKFDCVIGNPPWGSVPEDDDLENIRTRNAIGHKSQFGNDEIYKSVSDFQRSQAFLIKASDWFSQGTTGAMVVNNSIFLNENAKDFRSDFLSKFQLLSFYEFSDINKILFKKHRIGKIKSKPVEIGANEPCSVVVFGSPPQNGESLVSYIKPSLNRFAENLKLITYREQDIVKVPQQDLTHEDLLWRIFVNGGWDEYQIIKRRIIEKDTKITIECRSGFQPQKNMTVKGRDEFRPILKPSDFCRFHIKKKKLEQFNWSQTLRRRPEDSVFNGARILLTVRPLASDELRFRAVRVSKLLIHTHNILAVKISRDGRNVDDLRPYLAIFNSKFLGFYIYNVSSQWGKGDAKRSTLRNSDIENLPLPQFDVKDKKVQRLCELVDQIEEAYRERAIPIDLEAEADEIVYNLYKLNQYEKSVIDEFFKIHHSRKAQHVTDQEIQNYCKAFSAVFKLMLNQDYRISSSAISSATFGTISSFTIHSKDQSAVNSDDMPRILNIIQKVEMNKAYLSHVLKHEKVKYYDKQTNTFYIAKTNLFSDWTERQAINDANEEVKSVLKYLNGK